MWATLSTLDFVIEGSFSSFYVSWILSFGNELMSHAILIFPFDIIKKKNYTKHNFAGSFNF